MVEGEGVGLGIVVSIQCCWPGSGEFWLGGGWGIGLVSQWYRLLLSQLGHLPSPAWPSVSHPAKGFHENYLRTRPGVGACVLRVQHLLRSHASSAFPVSLRHPEIGGARLEFGVHL